MRDNMINVLSVILLSSLLFSCGGKEESKVPAELPPINYKTDTSKPAQNAQVIKPPIINIVDTVSIKRMVLVIKDSASSSERIGIKMAKIYRTTLPDIIKKNNIQISGPRMAWYKSSTAPFFFEAGLPINKKPTGKLPKNVSVKTIKTDSVFVAHYYGPYESTYLAYEALRDMMKERKKKPSSPPFELYIGEMINSKGEPMDPYKVRTDIVFPYK